MRSLAIALAFLAGPALADGLEIDVTGEANGTITIDLFEDVAPLHVAQITAIAAAGGYDGVVFHRVIDGFMAQTGDGQFGNGTGGSNKPDLKAEFNNTSHLRGTVSMARTAVPDSANSQFFICFGPTPHLDGQYTVFGQVVKGMEFIDGLKKGSGQGGEVTDPDKMISVKVVADI